MDWLYAHGRQKWSRFFSALTCLPGGSAAVLRRTAFVKGGRAACSSVWSARSARTHGRIVLDWAVTSWEQNFGKLVFRFECKRFAQQGIKMSAAAKELFLVGLRNAYAMENQAQEMLERQAGRLEKYPEIKQMVDLHLEETKEQISRLDQCLKMFDESPSTVKNVAQSLIGNLAALAHTMADDEVLKNTFANNAFENFEIAAYRSLIALCDRAGAAKCKPLLTKTLREEEKMAAWVAANVENATLAFLDREKKAA
jgi:ferritin-like metal-binding protein YciE